DADAVNRGLSIGGCLLGKLAVAVPKRKQFGQLGVVVDRNGLHGRLGACFAAGKQQPVRLIAAAVINNRRSNAGVRICIDGGNNIVKRGAFCIREIERWNAAILQGDMYLATAATVFCAVCHAAGNQALLRGQLVDRDGVLAGNSIVTGLGTKGVARDTGFDGTISVGIVKFLGSGFKRTDSTFEFSVRRQAVFGFILPCLNEV